MVQQLLFVCLGNICRSPAAENIMNHLITQANLPRRITCDSAGTGDYHIGKSPDQRMAAAARRRGITLRGQARQIQPSDLKKFDLILAMDRQNYQNILALDRSGQYHYKVRLICDFCTHYPNTEVPDPYFGGSEGFQSVINLLLDACEGLLHVLTQTKTVL
jgi:protein-tyrosine phosphatase